MSLQEKGVYRGVYPFKAVNDNVITKQRGIFPINKLIKFQTLICGNKHCLKRN